MKTELRMQIALAGEKSILQEVFVSTPLKVANITEDKRRKVLKLMLMSSSPGILDGDDYQLEINLAAGTACELWTQSYQRLFTMAGSAKQEMVVRVGEGASFQYLPQPTVPHRESNFKAINRIYLEEKSRLVWGEVFTCGRKLNGEIFAFTRFHNRTEIYRKGKLVVRENLLLTPKSQNPGALGLMEGFTHQASLLFLDETLLLPPVVATFREFLGGHPGLAAGVTILPPNGLLVRILGQHSEELFLLLKTLVQMLPIYGDPDQVKGPDKSLAYA